MTDGQSEACAANEMNVTRNLWPKICWSAPLEMLVGVDRWVAAKLILETPTTKILASVNSAGDVELRRYRAGDDTPPFVRNAKPTAPATNETRRPGIDLDRPVEVRRLTIGEWVPAEVVWRDGAVAVIVGKEGTDVITRTVHVDDPRSSVVRNRLQWRPFNEQELLKLVGRTVQRITDGKPDRWLVNRVRKDWVEIASWLAVSSAELLEKYELVGSDGETLYKCGVLE